MNEISYKGAFLPLRFFLSSVIVHCPACYGKAFIRTNIPPVKEQEVVNYLFNDAGTISCYHFNDEAVASHYCDEYDIWRKKAPTARFTCTVCPKYLDWDPCFSLKTWHGPLKGSASAFCAQCEAGEYKQPLTQETYVRKRKDTKLPSETTLSWYSN